MQFIRIAAVEEFALFVPGGIRIFRTRPRGMHHHRRCAGIRNLEERRALIFIQGTVLHPLCGCACPGVLVLAVFVVQLTLIVSTNLTTGENHPRRRFYRFLQQFLLFRRRLKRFSFNNTDTQ